MKQNLLQFVTVVIIAACATEAALAERDVEYVRMLREQRFWEVAEQEADRLLEDPQLDEDTRVGLLLEKARLAKDAALLTFDAEKQTALIMKARDILSRFLAKYSSRPERFDAQFELHFLGRLLGRALAASAPFETDSTVRASLLARARNVFAGALAGYEDLEKAFLKRENEIKSEIGAARKELRETPVKDSAAADRIARRIDELGRKLTEAGEYIIFCRYLAANCLYQQGSALADSEGLTTQTKNVLNDAIARFDKFFTEYRKTPYIQTAYDALVEMAQCMRLLKKNKEALDRIIGETTRLLVEQRHRIEERPVKYSLAGLRLAQARLLNDLGRHGEALRLAAQVMGGGYGVNASDAACIEYARALFLKGEHEEGIKQLSKIAESAGPFRFEAKQLLSEWTREDVALTASLPFTTQFDMAMLAYSARDFEHALEIFNSIESATAGRDEPAWDPKCLFQAAYCHYHIGVRKNRELDALGKNDEARTVLALSLAQAVNILWGKLTPRYESSEDSSTRQIVRNSLYLALKWQNDIVRLSSTDENSARLREILKAFNRHFPNSHGVPDDNYLRAVSLEREGKYDDAIGSYQKVHSAKNQSRLALVRIGVCLYHAQRTSAAPRPEDILKAWKALQDGFTAVSDMLNIKGEGELEKFERDDFGAALAEATYYRAAIVFSAGDEQLKDILPEGKDRYSFTAEILKDFDQKYPSSAFEAAASFLKAAALLQGGKTEEVEQILLRLEKNNPDMYRSLLIRLRDVYYTRYIKALEEGDTEAAPGLGALYITAAERFFSAFEEHMTLSDYIRMANYYYDAGRYGQATPLLRRAVAGLEDRLKKGGFESQEAKTAAEESLDALTERLADSLFEGEPKSARALYAKLEEKKIGELERENPAPSDFQQAFENDAELLRYRSQRAICDVRIEKEAAGPVPDFDLLAEAVKVLAGTAGQVEPNSDRWWAMQYWLACGLYLQKDRETALRFIANLDAATGNFSEGSGALRAGPEGKTFRQLFAELKQNLSAE
ncbi:MAG: hypothetical protein ABIH04_01860 [Planctomycetota bacterium]